ncbi:hypothetical protein ACDA55_36800, partial [Rhizobium ruizarguesonis]
LHRPPTPSAQRLSLFRPPVEGNRRFVFETGELKGIERKERKVHLNPLEIDGRRILPERAISYDTLILATGSEANDFGKPGVRDHCLTIDSRSQAMNFNRKVM